MGITVRYLLNQEFFKDFQVIAGAKGLGREIQGVTVLDAPDGFKWTMGKELVLTSGYAIREDPDAICDLMPDYMQELAALVIKRGRYLSEIPQKLLDWCDSFQVPVIMMPYTLGWMEMINQINVVVLNHAIAKLFDNVKSACVTSDRNYKEQKIQRLLQTAETEMSFPTAIHDVFAGKTYFSSQNFVRISEQYGLTMEDYWHPEIPHTCHTLCDYIHMCRYRLEKNEAPGEPRISWVTIPIVVQDVPQAYFCVMESRRFMDFYDESFMRIAFIMLQGIYEQIAIARSVNHIGYENLIHTAMEYTPENGSKLMDQARQMGVRLDHPYRYVLFHCDHEAGESFDIRSHRGTVMEQFRRCPLDQYGFMALTDFNEGILVIDSELLETPQYETLGQMVQTYQHLLSQRFDQVVWTFVICDETAELTKIRGCLEKYKKILRMGAVATPQQRILRYEALGVLTWLDIPEDELQRLLEPLRILQREGKQKDLLQTLRVYLECNLNYSTTADRLYVNINTVRRRIDRINDLISIDWDNYMERMKIGVLIQFLH